MKKKIFIIFVLLPLRLLLSQTNSERPFPFTKIGLNLYRIEVDVNSIIASIGPDGVLLCDVGGESKGPRVMATVRELGGETIGYIIDTHWHVDHTGGNKCFGKEALIIAHENVRKRLSENKYLTFWDEEHPAFPDYALPDVIFSDRITLHLNGEDIEITHLSCGHTDGDAVVYFRKSNILHVGDCLFTNGFPAIDFEMGGSVEGFAENLKKIAAMMPADVTIIAGHGPDYTIKELRAYETMVRSSLDAVRDAMQKSMTLEAMLQADLLKEWTEYSHGFFSCDEWIKMIHQSLIHNSSISSKMVEPWPRLKGPYLGQKPPGMTPEIFAPGIISTDCGEFNSVFSPDGNEFYYSKTNKEKKKDQIMCIKRVNNLWTKPAIAPFSGEYDDCDMSISYDGQRFFFISIGRILPGGSTPTKHNYMWFMERTQTGWGEPQLLEYPGNVGGVYPISTDNGTLYFSSRLEENFGKADIYRSRLVNGSYAVPENLGSSINSKYRESDTFVAPDESFMIVTCWERPENFGGGKSDLYISFRKRDGSWTTLQNMGKLINTEYIEFCPMLSPDGKYFFFSSDRTDVDECDIYWVDAKIIEDLKPKESGTFTDPRDGHVYKWVKIGNQIWMAENLRFKTDGGSWCWENNEENCKKRGRLYDWPAAMQAPPPGWHLPSDEEWKELERTLGLTEQQADQEGFRVDEDGLLAGKIKLEGAWSDKHEEKSIVITNETGFSAVKTGLYSNGEFSHDGYTGWWTSDGNDTHAWIRHIGFFDNSIGRILNRKEFAFPVRCIKDKNGAVDVPDDLNN